MSTLRACCLLLSVLAIGFLAGCPRPLPRQSGDFDQDVIAQYYWAEYRAEIDWLTVGAKFVAQGTSPLEGLHLTPPSAVTHNLGLLEEWNPANDWGRPDDALYRFASAGFRSAQEWEWRDTLARSYRNSVTMAPIFLVGPPPVISIAEGSTLSFQPAVGDGETVLLRIAVEFHDLLYRYPWSSFGGAGETSEIGATSVSLGPDSLAPYRPRDYVMKLVREKRGDLQEATPAGGAILAVYHSEHVPVTLVP